jgi:hypothetical protein
MDREQSLVRAARRVLEVGPVNAGGHSWRRLALAVAAYDTGTRRTPIPQCEGQLCLLGPGIGEAAGG